MVPEVFQLRPTDSNKKGFDSSGERYTNGGVIDEEILSIILQNIDYDQRICDIGRKQPR